MARAEVSVCPNCGAHVRVQPIRNDCIFYIVLIITGERISLRSSAMWLNGNDYDGMSRVLKEGKDYTSETVIKLLLKIMKGRRRR